MINGPKTRAWKRLIVEYNSPRYAANTNAEQSGASATGTSERATKSSPSPLTTVIARASPTSSTRVTSGMAGRQPTVIKTDATSASEAPPPPLAAATRAGRWASAWPHASECTAAKHKTCAKCTLRSCAQSAGAPALPAASARAVALTAAGSMTRPQERQSTRCSITVATAIPPKMKGEARHAAVGSRRCVANSATKVIADTSTRHDKVVMILAPCFGQSSGGCQRDACELPRERLAR
mmetsp:Transcript_12980/g.32955  ORF Transcript_12980/g.32955 Transcript_12980/m.32955 type:complete len:238 (-) Transcript_12980:312-1025(-)